MVMMQEWHLHLKVVAKVNDERVLTHLDCARICNLVCKLTNGVQSQFCFWLTIGCILKDLEAKSTYIPIVHRHKKIVFGEDTTYSFVLYGEQVAYKS